MSVCHFQRGSVLVLTLWLAAGLAAGALLAGHAVVLRYRREGNRRAALYAEHATDAGRCYVAQVLTTLASAGALPDVTTYTAADIAVGECRLWLLGRSTDATAETPEFALQDEAGRLSLNEPTTLAMLEALPGMTAELAAAIVDWRDANDDLSSDGAEAETYLARDPPSLAKNAPFETVDELRLLNGAEAYLLAGIDRNRNGILEPWERQFAEPRQARFRDRPDYGCLDLLTVHSREPNTTAAGQPRANLKTMTPLQLSQAIRPGQPPADSGIDPRSLGSVLDLCLRVKISEEVATQIFERFTVSDQSVLIGRVNINTAPAAVLASLPGVGVDNAAQLVAYREQNPTRLQTPLWLAAALGDEIAKAVAAGDYVTTKSYQVAADIVAVGPGGRAFRRTRFVFDLTTGTPLVVSRRDLTHLGWPLGEALRHELVDSTGGGTL
jgi:DNA uptake protein ComE-like DNA-binding protein